jgi:hypothetical protein
VEKDPKGKDYDKELKKLNLMIAKQDKLLYICFTVLLNLAEDPVVEKKMKNRKIITFLLRMLERNDFHLLIVSLLFLKKLSIVGENKLQMVIKFKYFGIVARERNQEAWPFLRLQQQHSPSTHSGAHQEPEFL